MSRPVRGTRRGIADGWLCVRMYEQAPAVRTGRTTSAASMRRYVELSDATRLRAQSNRGNSLRIGLVGCVKSKQSDPAIAADLYRSALFRGRRRWVQTTCGRWFVLSAKHGLVSPPEMLEPYDETLTTKGLAERRVRRAARTRRRAVRSRARRARPRGRVHDDFLSGVRSGVNGTPSFYINGARHDESFDTETLLTALQRATASGR